MSDYDDDNTNEDLPAALRKQLKEKDKELKATLDRLTAIEKRDRERTLGDVFKEKGLPAKAAKFFPADTDASVENVESWLTENADVFGFKPVETKPDEATPQVPDAYGRLANIQSPQGDSGGDAALLHSINGFTNEADLLALITANGGGAL